MAIIDFLTQDTPDGSVAADLVALIDKIPHQPSQTKVLFETGGLLTTTAKFDRTSFGLRLVQSSARGTDAPASRKSARDMVHIEAVRLAEEMTVDAAEIQNLRRLGSAGDVESVEGYIARELREPVANVRATLEWHRVGALRGLVLDADGAVITDLWTKMGVTAPTDVEFVLDAVSPAPGAVRKLCAQVVRAIEDELGGQGYGEIQAFVGHAFFDAITNHPEVTATYLNQQAAAELRGGTANGELVYGGIRFIRYRGKIGAVDFVAADEARFFPTGAGVFHQLFAPADRMAFVNSLGMAEYALPYVDPKDRFRSVEIQSNPITVCLRPGVLLGGVAGSVA
jgi:hypothetical protein